MARDIKEITEKLEAGVKNIFSSEEYKDYLRFMGKFYNYSVNNSILIMLQKPDATLVAGYKAWQTKFKRQVRRGEKGITIIAPIPRHIKKEVNGEEVEQSFMLYRAVTVFDISQTDGDEIPSDLCNDLVGDIDNYDELVFKLIDTAPCPVEFGNIEGEAHGYYSHVSKKIVVKNSLSEVQKVKTLIHEIAHSILHNQDDGLEKDADRNTKEVQAESVAFTVCNMLGIDASDYSFGYIAGWSKDKNVKELVSSMEIIRKTSIEIFDGLIAQKLEIA